VNQVEHEHQINLRIKDLLSVMFQTNEIFKKSKMLKP
jgi:hypothetical protein